MHWPIINSCLWLVWLVCWYIPAIFAARAKYFASWPAQLVHAVTLGFGFFLIFHDRDHPLFYARLYEATWTGLVGTAITAIGLLFTGWARLHLGKYWSAMVTLKQGHQLIRSGPYRLVRHPIYTGFLAAALGTAVTVATGDAMVGFGVIVASCLFKINREEKLLTSEFGDEYRQFKSEVAMLVPFVL